MSNYQSVKDTRQRQKIRAVYVMGNKCGCCGYNKCISALEFHHLDPSKKSFTIQTNANRSWDTIRNELPKTILVCANCHREIHAGIIDNNTLVSNFSEQKAQEIDEEIANIKTKTLKYCINCGAIISSKATMCTTCYQETVHRKITQVPNREELKQQIRTMSMIQVGKLYGISDNAMRKWCIKLDLPARAADIKSYTDEEWELL